MGKFLVVVAATVALNAFAPLAHAQDYVVNGYAAFKAEAQFLASYSAPAGHWQVDGYGFSRVADEHPVQAVAQTAGQKCWYVLDVKLWDRISLSKCIRFASARMMDSNRCRFIYGLAFRWRVALRVTRPGI